MVNPPTIVLNSSGNRLQTEDGEYYVQFEFNGRPLKMNITETVCPPRFRKYLLSAAFDYAREFAWDIEPTCPHARAYAEKNPSRHSRTFVVYDNQQPISETSSSDTSSSETFVAIEQLFRDNLVLFISVSLLFWFLDPQLDRLLLVLVLVFVGLYRFWGSN